MEITGPQLNTFLTVLTDLAEHDIKVTDWDNHGNVELQWMTFKGDVERQWIYSADGLVETINEIKENRYLHGDPQIKG